MASPSRFFRELKPTTKKKGSLKDGKIRKRGLLLGVTNKFENLLKKRNFQPDI